MSQTMKFAAATVAALALSGGIARAGEHITRTDGARSARLQMSEYADGLCAGFRSCDFASYPRMTARNCGRVSATRLTCSGSFTLYTDKELYPFKSDRFCNALAAVHLVRGNVRVRVYDGNCVT